LPRDKKPPKINTSNSSYNAPFFKPILINRLQTEPPTICYPAYNAGSCFLLALFVQFPNVRADKDGYFAPQHLQTYWDFSEPSYNSCFLLGLFEQFPNVNAETLG
jgi:hypothetical protein